RTKPTVTYTVLQSQTTQLSSTSHPREITPQGRKEGPRQGSLPARPRRLPQEGRPAGHEKNLCLPSHSRLGGTGYFFYLNQRRTSLFRSVLAELVLSEKKLFRPCRYRGSPCPRQ